MMTKEERNELFKDFCASSTIPGLLRSRIEGLFDTADEVERHWDKEAKSASDAFEKYIAVCKQRDELAEALRAAFYELHEIRLTRQQNLPPRNPELTDAAYEKARATLERAGR